MQTADKYYGGFFWLAIVSFVVPLFVGWYAFNAVQPTPKPTPTPDASGVDHALFDYVLKRYVENGLIDYDGIAKELVFTKYIQQLSAADPEKLDSNAKKLALHCNAYNAFVINGVISHRIHIQPKNVLDWSASDTDETGFFDVKEHILAGKTLSLNQLEHEIIRPVFQEPRIHVALVCAAKSCPSIRPEAYVGQRIDQQLEDQSVLFANNPTYVELLSNEVPVVALSPILNWYGEDFDQAGGILKWVSERVEDPALKSVLNGEPEIEFKEYDWSLNSQAPGSASKGGGASFGSGSVPNSN